MRLSGSYSGLLKKRKNPPHAVEIAGAGQYIITDFFDIGQTAFAGEVQKICSCAQQIAFARDRHFREK
jgi:hypothetical protein